MQNKRQQLLGGLNTNEAEVALNKERAKIGETFNNHKEALEEAKQQQIHAKATLDERISAYSFAQITYQEAQDQYQTALKLIPEELRRLVEQSLRDTNESLEELRDIIYKLEQRKLSSEITLKDRQKRLQQHNTIRPKPLTDNTNEALEDISLLLRESEQKAEQLHAQQAKNSGIFRCQ